MSTIVHRRRNKILVLRNTVGEWITDPASFSNMIQAHFQQLFCTEVSSCSRAPPSFSSWRRTLDSSQSASFLHPILPDEITDAFFTLKPYKSPGPDGLHACFYQSCWDIIGTSVQQAVLQFFESFVLPEGANNTLITLILKTSSPETIFQYRPISLCNTIYKIISKILVRRLRPHLSDLISPFQCSFIPGRRASDNVILLREIIHSFRRQKGKQRSFVLKLDLEKAFDRLKWNVIRKVLHHFGLPEQWSQWIMSCVSSTSTSVLLNGNCLEPFIPSRGIRQGDPISPYIFIMCMEYLKIHLVSWDVATMPKASGGLGIPNMNSCNKALLGSLVSQASTSREPWACLLRLQLNTRNPTDLGRASTNWKAIKIGSPGSAGAGGFIRDSLGRWVSGFKMNLGCTTSPIAELKPLCQGLIIAAECGASKLIVELDAKLVLDWIFQRYRKHHRTTSATSSCRRPSSLYIAMKNSRPEVDFGRA
ncbi:hypothetical protein CRG98_042208 [Punica granatum]|uniref:Reverse transcriptase domain-containing protein n=1 Tax=Punica granatum TaxID=22663 RepID=A0A2I0I0E4_PUNGR|nr:hypothetical protein CRG98_042208 [Punica granatum]